MPATKHASLGWGQRYMWLRHHQQPESDRHESNLVLTCRLEHEISVASLRAMVNHVVRRHEGLRTTFHHDADRDPEQRVHPPAPLRVGVVTTERDGTPSPADVVGQLGSTPFDLAAEWPVRACVVTTGGTPTRLVLAFCHLSVDRWTIARIDHDLAVLYAAVRAGRPARLEPVRHQPLDLAHHEASAAAEDALFWWRDELARLPADPMARRRVPAAGVTAQEATLTSPSTLAAGRAVAARHGVWPSLVHLTAYSAVMAAYTGVETVGLLCFTSNRESTPFAEAHTCLFSPQLMRVDCAGDPTFQILLDRVGACFEQARRHSYVPYDATVELAARESARRGQTLRLGAELNLVGEAARESGARRTSLIARPAPATWASAGADTYVRINEWRDAIGVSLTARATVMDADAVERFLLAYERTVLAAEGAEPGPRLSAIAAAAGFAAPARRPVSVRGDLVDLDRTRAVLLTHPAVRAVELSTSDREGLVADVLADPPTTPADLRDHILGRLDDRCTVRCPNWFRVHHRGQVPECAGDGHAPAPPVDPTEHAMANAVRRANGLDRTDLFDLSCDYVSSGGRVLRIPRVLSLLAEQGLTGLCVNDLASAVPLRALAARLTRAGSPLSPTDLDGLAVGADLAHT